MKNAGKVLALLITGLFLGSCQPTPMHDVDFQVMGTGAITIATVGIGIYSSGLDYRALHLPFTKSIRLPEGDVLSLRAMTTAASGTLTVTIVVDSVPTATDTATAGAPGVVQTWAITSHSL